MRVSFTDQWQVLFDENGKPLIGRVKFMNADATQFKHVYYYDNNGTETLAPNPCYTLQDGRLEHQIFLDYGAYTCIVEKFIGVDVSNMSDYASDNAYWTEIKRFMAFGGEDDTSDVDSGEDLFHVDTIADLRDVNPDKHSVVSVIGYYSREDGIDPRTYVWKDGNDDAEDYGSTIVSSVGEFTGTGRWKLCETPVLSATTFGVFPDRGSTIDASELTIKASALALFANTSKVCSSVSFNAGHYYFSAGARLSFKKKVVVGGTIEQNSTIMFDMDGVQDLPEGETLDGSVEISFIGGSEFLQKTSLCSNGTYITFKFGAGSVRTSWIDKLLYKHIDASSPYEDITLYLDADHSVDLCSDNMIFKGWKFIGCDKSSYNKVPNGCVFKNCTFDGKCFRTLGVRVSFLDCGTIYQSSVRTDGGSMLSYNIWNDDGSVKSTGTKFVCSEIRMSFHINDSVITYDNSNVVPIGQSPKITNPSEFLDKMKFFDRTWILDGPIGFVNEQVVHAGQYESFDDCMTYALESEKKVDLEGGSYSYTIDATEAGNAIQFEFCNGTLTLAKNGNARYEVVKIKDLTLNVDSSFNGLMLWAVDSTIGDFNAVTNSNWIDLVLDDCIVTCTNLVVRTCKANATSFDGYVKLIPNDGVINQKIDHCTFNHPLRVIANDTGIIVFLELSFCTFEIDNSGTSINAIIPTIDGTGTFADEEKTYYKIENVTCLNDAVLKPVYKAIVPVEADSDVTERFQPEGSFEDTLFHFGRLIRYIVFTKKVNDEAYNRDTPIGIGDDITHIINNDTKVQYPYRFCYIVERM